MIGRSDGNSTMLSTNFGQVLGRKRWSLYPLSMP